MKILIRSEGWNISLRLPTRLLFSKLFLNRALNVSNRYTDAVPDRSPAAITAFCREIRRIKKARPDWELVNIRTGDGTEIHIIP